MVTCPVNEYGVIQLDKLEKLVDNNTVLISVMTANGEIGTIQPIKKAVEIAHKYDILFHTDATAAIGQIKIDVVSRSPPPAVGEIGSARTSLDT